MKKFIPYGKQWVSDEDIQEVSRVLESDWLTTGPNVDAFEAALCEAGAAKHAVAVNSGTAALHAAYAALGIGPGDNVIVPAMTFSATANAAIYLGAEPRFADISPDTLTIDPKSVESLLDEHTKAVVAVDFAGHPADYDALRAILPDGCALVADAAHSIGATYKGMKVGSVADLSCTSFHPVKTITTGEGGAIWTDNDEWAARMRAFRTHGILRPIEHLEGDPDIGGWGYDIAEIGYNYRITDFQCALGLSQIAKLDTWIQRRQEIAGMYREGFADLAGLTLPPQADWASHAYHLFVIRVPASRRRPIFDSLRERGVGVQVHYIPVNMLTAYRKRGFSPEDTPQTLKTYSESISIPCFPRMTNEDVNFVIETVREVVSR